MVVMANQKITIDFDYHITCCRYILLIDFFWIFPNINTIEGWKMCKSFLMNDYWFYIYSRYLTYSMCWWLDSRYESTHIFFEYFFINNHPTNQSITANENKISCKNIHQMLPYSSFWYIYFHFQLQHWPNSPASLMDPLCHNGWIIR